MVKPANIPAKECKVTVCHQPESRDGFCEKHAKLFFRPPVRNKYKARKTDYNGLKYDSRREAEHARNLDWLVEMGEVREWSRQYPVPLIVNGQKICTYRIDFRVVLPDGSIELHEVKGYETKDWKLKWKLAHALKNITPELAGCKLILIK